MNTGKASSSLGTGDLCVPSLQKVTDKGQADTQALPRQRGQDWFITDADLASEEPGFPRRLGHLSQHPRHVPATSPWPDRGRGTRLPAAISKFLLVDVFVLFPEDSVSRDLIWRAQLLPMNWKAEQAQSGQATLPGFHEW